MAGIFQGDLVIRTALTRGIADLRQNPWLLDHIFSSISDLQQVKSASDFFINNDFSILMSNRIDVPPAYFISIMLGESKEMRDMAFLGDLSNEKIDYTPQQINKPIPYVIKPFKVVSYDPATGVVTMPDLPEYKYLNAGMVSVNNKTGDASKILEVLGNSRYVVAPNSLISDTQAIIPAYPLYRANLESASFSESYTIGIHASGDMLYAIYLHSIVSYCLLRYRESLLEAEGFQISSISSSAFSKSQQYEAVGENMFNRYITLTGQVQNYWVKSPQRFIESVDLYDSANAINPAGIKIISSDRLPDADSDNDLWSTISDSDDIVSDSDDDDFWKQP